MLQGYTDMSSFCVKHCVKAELVVVKELLVCQDQQLVEEIGSSFHGKMFETEDSPVLEFCSWNCPFGKLCFTFRWRTFAQVIFKQRGLYTVWMVKVSDVFCLCIFMVDTHTMWITFVNHQSEEEVQRLLKYFLSFCYFWIYVISWTSWIVSENAGHVFKLIIPQLGMLVL